MAGITHRHGAQIIRRDTQYGNVGSGIAADQFRLETAVVFSGDFYIGRILDNMAVGQYVAVRGVDDDTRPDCFGLTLDRLVAEIEELREQRILNQRIVLADFTAHGDARDAWSDSAHHAGNTRHRCAASFGYRSSSERRMWRTSR